MYKKMRRSMSKANRHCTLCADFLALSGVTSRDTYQYLTFLMCCARKGQTMPKITAEEILRNIEKRTYERSPEKCNGKRIGLKG